MSPVNVAAWLLNEKNPSLVVKESPFPTPGPFEVVLRVRAVAINPIDWMIQHDAFMPLSYPTILGQDAAGEVVSVGSSVAHLTAGDRVIAQGMSLGTGDPRHGAFQRFVIVHSNVCGKIPTTITFESACTVPLGLATSACGLYLPDYLALPLPGQRSSSLDGCVIVWGGATSVGCNAIQLLVASGVEVITTASPSNFDFVKSLGATQVFDYRSPDIVRFLADATRGKAILGCLDCVSTSNSTYDLASVLQLSPHPHTRKFISMVLPGPDDLPKGVASKYIHGVVLKDYPGISRQIFGHFFPEALSNGSFQCAPPPLIAGHSLDDIQSAINLQSRGVSARKIVVTGI